MISSLIQIMKVKHLVFLAILAIFLPSLSLAQEKEEIPLTRISILLAGDPQENSDNFLPPSLKVEGTFPAIEDESIEGLRGISLKRLRDLVDVPLAENTAMSLKVEAGNPQTKNWKVWTQMALPPGATGRDVTFLYYKEKPAQSWVKHTPKMLMLDNSLEAVPEGGVRVINVSSLPVYCQIDGKEVRLNPQSVGVLPAVAEDKQQLECEFSFRDSKTNKLKVFFRNNFNRNQKQRQQIVFYNLDGKQGRKFSPINLMMINLLDLDRPSVSERIKQRAERPPYRPPTRPSS